MLKVRILENEGNFISDNITHYSCLKFNQATSIFFPNKYKYKLVDKAEKADICIVGIQHEDNDLLRHDEMNIFMTVENLSVDRHHYRHFNKFNRYNNDKIDLYYYNDTKNVSQNTIPIPLCFIRQFVHLEKMYNHLYHDVLNTKFEDKKFCLFVSKNLLNNNKRKVYDEIWQYGKIDHITLYDDIIENKSCYNTIELLKIFNSYKFIICFENSHTNDYVTEKLFNVFLSKSIAIYDGAPNIDNYVNNTSFIKYDKNYLKKMIILSKSKDLYENFVNRPKINSNINIEDFENKLDFAFDLNLSKKKVST